MLEYGVGNGRVAMALARAGIDVVGIDSSRAMLGDLRRQLASEPPVLRRRLTLKRADMRDVSLGKRFKLVVAPFNVVLHLYTLEDVERFLTRVRDHLSPGGRFAFDFSQPRPADLCLDPERWYGAPRFRHPSGKLVRYAERFNYDAHSQVLHMTFRFTPVDGSPAWETELAHRQFFPREMEALLSYNGFVDVNVRADFTLRAPGSDSDSLVVECTRDAMRRARARRAAGRASSSTR